MPRFRCPDGLRPLRARCRRPAVLFALLAVGGVLPPDLAGRAGAQEVELSRIVAVVNDDPISVHDLTSRVRFTAATLGAPESPAARDRMVQEVLESLIDERLKVQAAKRLSVEIGGNEAEAAYARLAATFGMDPDRFARTLRQEGISDVTVWAKIHADVRWNRILRRRVVIEPQEVEKEIADIRAAEGQPEYRIARIVLRADGPDDRVAVRAEADRLRGELDRGADFRLLALRHSQGLPDSPGGDWVRGDAVDPALAAVLTQLGDGRVSAPVETEGAIYLVQLLERRALTVPGNEEVLRRQAEEQVFRRNAVTTDRALLQQLRAGALIDRRL